MTESCRIITGSIKPNPIGTVHYLAGLAPPKGCRREVLANDERNKVIQIQAHPLHGQQPLDNG